MPPAIAKAARKQPTRKLGLMDKFYSKHEASAHTARLRRQPLMRTLLGGATPAVVDGVQHSRRTHAREGDAARAEAGDAVADAQVGGCQADDARERAP